MPLSLGIDLASKNQKTAACAIEWSSSRTVAADPQLGDPKDERLDWLVALCGEADCIGIDAPFGWPDPMLDAVSAWAAGEPWPETATRELRFRLTDLAVVERTKRPVLSVSSDPIAIVAWRCARLLTLLAKAGMPVDRAEADGVFEVHPGAGLTCWGLDRAGYKTQGTAEKKVGQRVAREKLVEEISRRAPGLDLTLAREACIESDDALDALIASFIARAAARGKTTPPPADQADRIGREGWIHLPEPGTLKPLL
jgi:hypothetical protein